MLSLIPLVIDVDEAWFAASAAALNWPVDYFNKALDNKPPGTVWFFWCIQKLVALGTTPRVVRAVSVVVVVLTAWILSRFTKRRRRPYVVFSFLTASVIASPKLLSTTTEGLLLPFVCFAMWMCWRSLDRQTIRLWQFIAVGACLGVALVFKQTAVFFILPALYTAGFSLRKQLALGCGVVLPVIATMAVLGEAQYWYWTVTYPGLVLTSVRSDLFAQNQQLLINTIIFSVALWPLLLSCTVQVWRAFSQMQQRFLALWITAALFAIVIGKGLFLHYFILLVPPLCILFANIRRTRPGLKWLYVTYATACLIAAVPMLGVFWGVDLTYYERVGRAIREISNETDRVFVWGGNALPIVMSERRHVTRFVTARFATSPYATDFTEAQFKKDFLQDRPKVFVDLHERGDGRFATPVSAVPWLKNELAQSYTIVAQPSLPWATVYTLKGTQKRGLAGFKTHSRLNFDSLYTRVDQLLGSPLEPDHSLRFMQRCFSHPRNAVALESLLRAWEGLRIFSQLKPETTNVMNQATYHQLRHAILRQAKALTSEDSDLYLEDQELAKQTLVWLERQFRWEEVPVPLPVASRAWWVSAALVKFQPR